MDWTSPWGVILVRQPCLVGEVNEEDSWEFEVCSGERAAWAEAVATSLIKQVEEGKGTAVCSGTGKSQGIQTCSDRGSRRASRQLRMGWTSQVTGKTSFRKHKSRCEGRPRGGRAEGGCVQWPWRAELIGMVANYTWTVMVRGWHSE